MTAQLNLALPAMAPPSGTVVVNPRCVVRAEGSHRAVFVSGLPVHLFDSQDQAARAYAMVLMVDAGYATQKQVARAFETSTRTVRRHQRRYGEGGMAALVARSGWRPGRRRIKPKRLRVIEEMRVRGYSNREMARRLGVTENSIRKLAGPATPVLQPPLPLMGTAAQPTNVAPVQPEDTGPEENDDIGASSAEKVDATQSSIATSLDTDPSNRALDRMMARLGFLEDAAPVFGSSLGVPAGGVLFAVPHLVTSGILELAQKVYGEIGPAFYGTRTTMMTLLLMAVARIKRAEALKEHDPQNLGRVLGLDRAPETKTLRRKLARLASYHKAERLGSELGLRRVAERGQMMGFLYVDGHVRAYHGKRTIPKTHVARVRIAMPATTDYWVNDQAGDPLFVMTAQANASTTKMLPKVLAEVRSLVGERRVTVVFDRGGWSPKLFQLILDADFDILAYRKPLSNVPPGSG